MASNNGSLRYHTSISTLFTSNKTEDPSVTQMPNALIIKQWALSKEPQLWNSKENWERNPREGILSKEPLEKNPYKP